LEQQLEGFSTATTVLKVQQSAFHHFSTFNHIFWWTGFPQLSF